MIRRDGENVLVDSFKSVNLSGNIKDLSVLNLILKHFTPNIKLITQIFDFVNETLEILYFKLSGILIDWLPN